MLACRDTFISQLKPSLTNPFKEHPPPQSAYQHTRCQPGPPAEASSWTDSLRCCSSGRGRGKGKASNKGRTRDLQRVRQMSCGWWGWHGDSVDSTTPSGWSAACPSLHSAACGLNGRARGLQCGTVGKCPMNSGECSPRATALGLLEETVRVTTRWERDESVWTRVGQWALSFCTLLIICITSAALLTGLQHM